MLTYSHLLHWKRWYVKIIVLRSACHYTDAIWGKIFVYMNQWFILGVPWINIYTAHFVYMCFWIRRLSLLYDIITVAFSEDDICKEEDHQTPFLTKLSFWVLCLLFTLCVPSTTSTLQVYASIIVGSSWNGFRYRIFQKKTRENTKESHKRNSGELDSLVNNIPVWSILFCFIMKFCDDFPCLPNINAVVR